MADPVSMLGAVWAVTVTVLNSTQELIKLIRSVRGAPEDMIFISQDLQAFKSVLLSVQAIVTEMKTTKTSRKLHCRPDIVQNLIEALENSSNLISRLVLKTQNRIEPTAESGRFQIIPKNLKWGLFTKQEAKNLRDFLDSAKTTLNNSLTILLYESCNFCSPSMTKISETLRHTCTGRRDNQPAYRKCQTTGLLKLS